MPIYVVVVVGGGGGGGGPRRGRVWLMRISHGIHGFFGIGRGMLVSTAGHLLDPEEGVEEAAAGALVRARAECTPTIQVVKQRDEDQNKSGDSNLREAEEAWSARFGAAFPHGPG